MELLKALLAGLGIHYKGEAGRLAGQIEAEETAYKRRKQEEAFDLEKRKQRAAEEYQRGQLELGRGQLDLSREEQALRRERHRLDVGKEALSVVNSINERANAMYESLVNEGVPHEQALEAAKIFAGSYLDEWNRLSGAPVQDTTPLLKMATMGAQYKATAAWALRSGITDPQKIHEFIVAKFGSEEDANRFYQHTGMTPQAIAEQNQMTKRLKELAIAGEEEKLRLSEAQRVQMGVQTIGLLTKQIYDAVQATGGWETTPPERRQALLFKALEPYRGLMDTMGFTPDQIRRWVVSLANYRNWGDAELKLKEMELALTGRRIEIERQIGLANVAVRQQGLTLEGLMGGMSRGGAGGGAAGAGGEGMVGLPRINANVFGGTIPQSDMNFIRQLNADTQRFIAQYRQAPNLTDADRAFLGMAERGNIGNLYVNLYQIQKMGVSPSPQEFVNRHRNDIAAAYLASYRMYLSAGQPPENALRLAKEDVNGLIGNAIGEGNYVDAVFTSGRRGDNPATRFPNPRR